MQCHYEGLLPQQPQRRDRQWLLLVLGSLSQHGAAAGPWGPPPVAPLGAASQPPRPLPQGAKGLTPTAGVRVAGWGLWHPDARGPAWRRCRDGRRAWLGWTLPGPVEKQMLVTKGCLTTLTSMRKTRESATHAVTVAAVLARTLFRSPAASTVCCVMSASRWSADASPHATASVSGGMDGEISPMLARWLSSRWRTARARVSAACWAPDGSWSCRRWIASDRALKGGGVLGVNVGESAQTYVLTRAWMRAASSRPVGTCWGLGTALRT